MTANIFEQNGWDVHYLGANTPTKDVLSFIRTFRPDLIGISVTMLFNLESVMDTVQAIRDDSELKDIGVILGGYIFFKVPRAGKSDRCRLYCTEVSEMPWMPLKHFESDY